MFYSIIMTAGAVLRAGAHYRFTTSWKQQRSMRIQKICQKNTINGRFKRSECLMVSSHVSTLKHEAKHGYITQNLLFSCFTKQTDVSRLHPCLASCFSATQRYHNHKDIVHHIKPVSQCRWILAFPFLGYGLFTNNQYYSKPIYFMKAQKLWRFPTQI